MPDSVRIPLTEAAVRLRWPCETCAGEGSYVKEGNERASKCDDCDGVGILTGLVGLGELARLIALAASAGGGIEAEVADVQPLP